MTSSIESAPIPSETPTNTPTRGELILVSLVGASAVGIGAFGAHGLPDFLESSGVDAETMARRLEQFETGVKYHLTHAVVLLALTLSSLPRTRFFNVVRWLMLAGVIFFSGSLYVLVATNTPVLGAITPIGGVCWILAWLLIVGLRASSTRH
ncbi:DUF423 domain-containing protein [Rhodopirellula sp. JC740]|uniref:DUF423 domain-containing protein n=1 Tax=Rhodopirellula halodulae TaxID=2894198 RepID=A0ABS8NMW2_9BACT|nr:DUF423 domain-containing protein [Rhodopirellula sp. JC740]MCC9644882.1 DUF423 domain-containing protein [Rhodopirellula sp. JC740]